MGQITSYWFIDKFNKFRQCLYGVEKGTAAKSKVSYKDTIKLSITFNLYSLILL